jgi:tetratricopeptide (TPR) repeat protein
MEGSDMWTWGSPESMHRPGADRADHWLKQGKQCEEQHRLLSAKKAYEHATRSADSGTAAVAYYHLGLLYEEQHRYAPAVKAFRRAAASADRDTTASAYYHLGRLYEHRHQRASAIGAYEHAVRLGGPDSARARHALARLGA